MQETLTLNIGLFPDFSQAPERSSPPGDRGARDTRANPVKVCFPLTFRLPLLFVIKYPHFYKMLTENDIHNKSRDPVLKELMHSSDVIFCNNINTSTN